MRFHYDIHGIVRIASDVRLPELRYFGVAAFQNAADIDITVDGDGFGGLRRHRLVECDDHAVRYVEHLGRFGFAVDIRLGDVTSVQVSTLLRHSPHVLYTNVAEPLLRWTFVRKGYALVHAACLEMEGQGTLITAQTDTGKTTTCLMSVQHHDAGFVSDDMVIIDGSGTALAFPKPLTISAHTLQAARTAPLPWRRRWWLHVQSRLHSRNGRRTGLALSRMNLPVCTMNAWVQRVIPPPKFFIEELVPSARVVPQVRITHMGVIERGSTLVQPLFDLDSNLLVLRENTEDAYGFPPYPLIAAVLANGDVELEDAVRRHLLDGLPVHSDPHVGPTLVRAAACADDRGTVRPAGRGGSSPERRAFASRHRSSRRIDVRPGVGPRRNRLSGLPDPLSVPRTPSLRWARRPSLTIVPMLRREPDTWLTVAFVTAICVAAALLRLWQIGRFGFNSDEAVYAGQGAATRGVPELGDIFPIFRAHPLLFQLSVGLLYRAGVRDLTPRLLSVAFAIGTVAVVFALGKLLYGRSVGIVAALLVAVMPYHVVVSRQALLDGPMAFFATCTLFLLARYVVTERAGTFYASAAAMGLRSSPRNPASST